MENINQTIDMESATKAIENLCDTADGKDVWDNVCLDWFGAFRLAEKDLIPFTKTDAFWSEIGEPILMGNDGAGYNVVIVTNSPESLKIQECLAVECTFRDACKSAMLYILSFLKWQEKTNQYGSREVFNAYKAMNPPVLNRL
jgi:hypothetical protein